VNSFTDRRNLRFDSLNHQNNTSEGQIQERNQQARLRECLREKAKTHKYFKKHENSNPQKVQNPKKMEKRIDIHSLLSNELIPGRSYPGSNRGFGKSLILMLSKSHVLTATLYNLATAPLKSSLKTQLPSSPRTKDNKRPFQKTKSPKKI
jgi:hypothetical protein